MLHKLSVTLRRSQSLSLSLLAIENIFGAHIFPPLFPQSSLALLPTFSLSLYTPIWGYIEYFSLSLSFSFFKRFVCLSLSRMLSYVLRNVLVCVFVQLLPFPCFSFAVFYIIPLILSRFLPPPLLALSLFAFCVYPSILYLCPCLFFLFPPLFTVCPF